MVKSMTLTIVVLDNTEKFLRFLDPDLCHLEETIEYGGLRTLSFEYTFQDLLEDKELFRVGNKIWVQGDNNIDDCLYVINTEVEQDIYDENSFTFEIEEVLVELNYAPVFSQTELYYWVDNQTNVIYKTDEEAREERGVDWRDYVKQLFTVKTENGKLEVVVDWNALNYWFGEYFNLGVIQKCISDYASRISITGTVNRMDLLRSIEEETGNVFITRYEKDILDNTIHRYLDFLNPININKDWMWNLEYDFNNIENVSTCFDENGNIVTEDKDWEVIRYENTAFDPETIDEDTDTSHEDDYDVPQDDPYDSESQQIYPYEEEPDYTPIRNLNPNNCQFQITDHQYRLLNTEGKPYKHDGDTPLAWICSDTGMTEVDYPEYIITLQKIGNILSITVNNKSYALAGIGETRKTYLPELRDDGHISYNQDTERSTSKIPDDSYFEIYDHENNYCLFRSKLNTEIGHVHEEILDFGFNLDNIKFNVDETETYTAVSPVMNINDSNDRNNLSRTDMDTIINRWLNLEIKKGATVPMVVEKFNIEGTDYNNAVSKLGTSTRNTNYWIRPLKPTDNTDNDPKQFEFYRAVAYWKAPYNKYKGAMHVETDKVQNTEYTSINTRPDTRQGKGMIRTPKMGNTETTDEDVFMIYNQVCTYLKEHETPNIQLELDVANLQGHEFNNYELHDKIYVKLANTQELITARITKTSKEAHDIAKNTIEITNYRNINTIKTITHETYIEAPNSSFKYPSSKRLTARLINASPDETTDTYLANKLLTFTVYKLENQSSTLTGQVYTRLTDAYGYANLDMKFDPGDYEIDIQFGGDEEYEESHLMVNVNVSGTLPQPVQTPSSSSSSSNKHKIVKTNKKKKIVKLYWNKCGLSPDKKHKEIVSIAKPSGPDAGKYGYRYYKTVFKNYCPICKRWGYLRFDGGSKNKCITSEGARNRGYKIGVPEHEITCVACDSDYCGVTGAEKWYTVRGRLKTVKKPVKSSENEFNKLVKGKLQYGTKTVTVTEKKVVNTKERKIRAKGISSKIKKLALKIVGNATGGKAMMKIVAWCDKNIKYASYPEFCRSAETVLNMRSGNCCDGTRFFFELCDAAGLCEYYNFYYVHVQCPKYGHVYGIVETKKTKKWRYVDMASDSHTCWGYVIRSCPHGGRDSKYPTLPF